MKTNTAARVVALSLLFGALAQVEAQPTPSPAPNGNLPSTNPARGARGRGNPGPPATLADIAEMAPLMNLPPYASALGAGDYSVGPDYTITPEQTVRDNVPHGKVIHFEMDSAESKFYPGTAPFKRAASVYVPAQYVPGTPSPFIVSCDQYGLTNRTGLLPTVLDNMIADHRLPVMCLVMVNPGPGPERSIEYDTVTPKYTDFVESEVLPRAKEAGIVLTKDPEARMTLGGSSGGICAFTMAWFHPELYHRVVSYSGTFVNLQHSPEVPHGGWEYHENLIGSTPAKPLHVWLHASQNDNGAATASSAFRNWVIANKHMAETLKAKGYDYQFVYAKNAGHTDARAINQTIAQALEFVWKGYPVAGGK